MASFSQISTSQPKKILFFSPDRENILNLPPPCYKQNSTRSSNMPSMVSAPVVLRLVTIFPAAKDSLEATVSLLRQYKNVDHFAYEREGVWHSKFLSHITLLLLLEGAEDPEAF
jgi:hypothetical protein